MCHQPTSPEPGSPEKQLKADSRSPFNILLHFSELLDFFKLKGKTGVKQARTALASRAP